MAGVLPGESMQDYPPSATGGQGDLAARLPPMPGRSGKTAAAIAYSWARRAHPSRSLTISDQEFSLPWLLPRVVTHSFQVPRTFLPMKLLSGATGCQEPRNGPRPKPMYRDAWSSKVVPDRLAVAPPI